LSPPENKKAQINRILPRRRLFEENNIRKGKLCPEDFDPSINEVEMVRDGLEIHSKSIIIINKNLLTDDLFFPETNYNYKPKLNIAIPQSPKIQKFIPNGIPFSTTTYNFEHNFNQKNISIGPPTPMDGIYESQISPMGNMLIFPTPLNKNNYKVDFGYENVFMGNPYTHSGYPNNIITNTPKKEINLQDKIVIQNNNNNDEIIQNKKIKPSINLEYIDNYDKNTNNNPSPTFPFIYNNDNMGSSIPRQNISMTSNIFNLSPTSPFIPRNLGEKNL